MEHEVLSEVSSVAAGGEPAVVLPDESQVREIVFDRNKMIDLGRQIRRDWDGSIGQFVCDQYEQYLRAVQLGGKEMNKDVAKFANKTQRAYTRGVTFEDWLHDCLLRLRHYVAVELPEALSHGRLTVAMRDNYREIAEAETWAISKFLEGTPRERLIGVPEPGF